MTITLRDYQRESIDAIYSHFEARADNPLVVIPTGGGKSPTLATFIREAMKSYPGTRILCLVHVRELVAQNLSSLLRIWPAAPVGVCSAGLRRSDTHHPITLASIQSIFRRAYDLQRIDLVVVDEAHLIPHKDEGMYRQLFGDLLTINSAMKVVGYTATPWRMTSGRLDEGDGALFGAVAYDIGIAALIEKGWLNPLIPKTMNTTFDISSVHTRGGEFVALASMPADDQARVHLVNHGSALRFVWAAISAGVSSAGQGIDDWPTTFGPARSRPAGMMSRGHF